MSGNADGPKDSGRGRGPLGAFELLLGAAAVLSGALYVLVNALYIEFYDDFGVRPEQVGFDRLAVLARSAWVVLLFVPIVAAILGALYGAYIALGRVLLMLGFDLRGIVQRIRNWLILSAAIFTSLVLLMVFQILRVRIEDEADRVAHGHSSDGVGWPVPIIDARATRAEVNWIDAEKQAPPGLTEAEYLTYLGSGEGVTVLLACGESTYVVQSSDIVVTLLDQGRDNQANDGEIEDAEFAEACGY